VREYPRSFRTSRTRPPMRWLDLDLMETVDFTRSGSPESEPGSVSESDTIANPIPSGISPSIDLYEWIRDRHWSEDQLPVWHLGRWPESDQFGPFEIVVPRIDRVFRDGVIAPNSRGISDRVSALGIVGKRLAYALDHGVDDPYVELRPRDTTHLHSLRIAVLRDLVGLSERETRDSAEVSDSTLTRSLAESRAWLRTMNAWPWFHFDKNGVPPRSWRPRPLDASARHALENWSNGQSPFLRFESRTLTTEEWQSEKREQRFEQARERDRQRLKSNLEAA